MEETIKGKPQAEEKKEIKYTDAQLDAITKRDKTLLVSAAAGSGKTAVLTERIIRSLCDPEAPVDISRLLIVTFTRAAATEMRARISNKLSEAIATNKGNPKLTAQLMKLGSARISTIDSFYYDLVRENFEEAGFSPAIRLADDSELLSLRRDVMNGVIDHMFSTTPDFALVAELFSDVRSESTLAVNLLSVAEKLEKLPKGYDTLLDAADKNETVGADPFASPFGQAIYPALADLAKEGLRLYQALADYIEGENSETLTKKYKDHIDSMMQKLEALLSAIEQRNADGVAQALAATPKRVKSISDLDMNEDLATLLALRKEFYDLFKKKSSTLAVFHAREIAEGGLEAAHLLRVLHAALKQYDAQYSAAKKERGVAEFIDISRAAHRLLVAPDGTPTPLARSIASCYDAIYIDEYQDVDKMQDETFRAISKPRNRFMVGDIKQSIYRFRGADPDVFTNYRRTFKPLKETGDADDAAGIFMSENFRCDESIIRFSNTVSDFLFRQRATSIGYGGEDLLHFSKPDPVGDFKCRVMVVNDAATDEKEAQDDESDTQNAAIDQLEAAMIATEIVRLINEEKKADGKPIKPKDIAVLSRSTAFAAPLTKYLKEKGIAVNDTSRNNFFENPEVLCMYSLLAVIDNPFRDVYLAAVLRSPFFGFTLEELVHIRRATDKAYSLYEAIKAAAESRADNIPHARCARFLEKLQHWRNLAEDLPVDKLLRRLYRDTAALSLAGDQNRGSESTKRKNLQRLYEYARSFELGGFKGLYRFVRYVEDIMQNETKMPVPDGPPDAVSIITIHHSKGLEFPVCFVAGTGKTFNKDDTKSQLLIDSELGCGIRLPITGAFARANTFCREAVKGRLTDRATEEEMRVLYVAMTRARERLYITGKPRYGMENTDWHTVCATTPYTDAFRLCGNSYLEWILAALSCTPHDDYCSVTHHDSDEIKANFLKAKLNKQSTLPPEDLASVQEIKARLQKRFSFVYADAHLTRLPAKLSVSKLTPTILDVWDTDATPYKGDEAAAERAKEDAERLLHTFERTPSFDNAAAPPDGAAKGTATHEFLQFCDLRLAAADPKRELERLITEGFLHPDTRNAVRMDELKRFFKSRMFSALSGASDVRREVRFNILLPAKEFTRDDKLQNALTDEKLLVQGVIDLVFTDADGKLVLCDYKTDRLPTEAYKNRRKAAEFLYGRYGQQLSYYKKAVEALYGKAPDRTVIYSLPFGEEIEEP